MKEKDLYNILKLVSKYPTNNYPKSISLDLLEVAKNDLDDLNIKYEPFMYRDRERLKVYDNKNYVKTYVKNFYHNNSKFGFKLSNDKILTEKYLKLAEIPTTNSIVLNYNQLKTAKKHLKTNEKSFVIKPVNLAGGAGVFVDVTLEDIGYYWEQCIETQRKYKVEEPKVILQEMISGFEIRVIVTEGKALSATMRTPAYVIGDNQHTIEELIDNKNEKRHEDGFLYNKKIKKDDNLNKYLNEKNLTLESVLDYEELCILNPITNLVYGGENIVITEFINKNIMKLAEDAVASLPGIQTAGVDVMINNLEDEKGTILEINKSPAFQLNYYPHIGKPQEPLKYIFNSLILENRILENQLTKDEVNESEFNQLTERYRALYKKQKQLEKIIENIEKSTD